MAEQLVGGPASLAVALLRAQWPAVSLLVATAVMPPVLAGLCTLLAGAVLSSGLHEAGHALAFWHARRGGGPVVLRTRLTLALAVRLPVATPGRSVLVAGPALPALVGLVLGLVALGTHQPSIGLVAGVCGLHLFGLLPGNSDGDRIWSLTPSTAHEVSRGGDDAPPQARTAGRGAVTSG